MKFFKSLDVAIAYSNIGLQYFRMCCVLGDFEPYENLGHRVIPRYFHNLKLTQVDRLLRGRREQLM